MASISVSPLVYLFLASFMSPFTRPEKWSLEYGDDKFTVTVSFLFILLILIYYLLKRWLYLRVYRREKFKSLIISAPLIADMIFNAAIFMEVFYPGAWAFYFVRYFAYVISTIMKFLVLISFFVGCVWPNGVFEELPRFCQVV